METENSLKADPKYLIPADIPVTRKLRSKVAAGVLNVRQVGKAWEVSGAGVNLRVSNLRLLTPADLEPADGAWKL